MSRQGPRHAILHVTNPQNKYFRGRGSTFLKVSLVLLLRSWQTWAYFKAQRLLCRTRESTGTRESKGGESMSPKSWTRSSTNLYLFPLSLYRIALRFPGVTWQLTILSVLKGAVPHLSRYARIFPNGSFGWYLCPYAHEYPIKWPQKPLPRLTVSLHLFAFFRH